jgi:hypothetical protein
VFRKHLFGYPYPLLQLAEIARSITKTKMSKTIFITGASEDLENLAEAF